MLPLIFSFFQSLNWIHYQNYYLRIHALQNNEKKKIVFNKIKYSFSIVDDVLGVRFNLPICSGKYVPKVTCEITGRFSARRKIDWNIGIGIIGSLQLKEPIIW